MYYKRREPEQSEKEKKNQNVRKEGRKTNDQRESEGHEQKRIGVRQ
jgi:hypothetical protein